MNDMKQIKMTKKMQDKFYHFINFYREQLSLPAFKALSDITWGILASGSVIVNQCAIKLEEDIPVEKSAARLCRNLRRPNFADTLRQEHMQKQCRQFDEETLVIVDESDIIKPCAAKMEGLKKVWDGSTGRHDQSGYDLLNLIAYKKQNNGYQMIPVSSDLYSGNIETDTLANLLEDRIDEITLFGHNKCIFVFDRGFDRRANLAHLVSNANSFIIRGVGKRNIVVDGDEKPFKEVCQTIEKKYQVPGKTSDQHFQCGIKRIRVRTDDHPSQKAASVELFLIVAQYKNKESKLRKGKPDKRDGYFYFLCDFPNRDLGEEEIIAKVLSYYRHRWKIEQTHRQLKQDYKWESMQLQTYEGLKNLNMIFWIAISFLYSCKDQIMQWAQAFPRQFGQYRKKLPKLFDFVYSALMKAVKVVFENWSIYDYGATDTEPLQLHVRFV